MQFDYNELDNVEEFSQEDEEANQDESDEN